MNKYLTPAISITLVLTLTSCVSYLAGKLSEETIRFPVNGQSRTTNVGENLIVDMAYSLEWKTGKEVMLKGKTTETITVTVTEWSSYRSTRSSREPKSTVDLQYTIPANLPTELRIQYYLIKVTKSEPNGITFEMVSGMPPEEKDGK